MSNAFDIAKARIDSARAVLRMRADVQKFLEEAHAIGNHKEARRWESELRKVNKLITQYGLDRNA